MQTQKTTALAARHCYAFTLLITVFLLCTFSGQTQTVTLNVKNATLQKIITEVEKQTGYPFFFNRDLLKTAKPITVSATKIPLAQFLEQSLKDQPFSYRIESKYILLTQKGANQKDSSQPSSPGSNLPSLTLPEEFTITGSVTDGKSPIVGASVFIKGTSKGTITNERGNFSLPRVRENEQITITMVGYEMVTMRMNKSEPFHRVTMKVATSQLDEAIVQAYGVTTRRLATGNITKISGDEIRQQPVMNPLMALQGRVPGMLVTPMTGYASAPVRVEIRGRNSLNETFSGEPLYVIDGIVRTVLDVKGNFTRTDYGLSNGFAQGGYSRTGGQSILFGMNPNDIESIEVLKDGDATAIYGSRGANGVIIITTKKAKPGKSAFSMDLKQGITDVPRHIKMLNTQEYLAVRREAFKNDGRIPTAANAPDLMLWDTTRYTDWQKELFHTGKTTTVSASYSGGDNQNTFRLSTNYSTQKGQLHSSGKDEALNMAVNLNHRSLNQKLSISMTAAHTYTFVDAIAIGKEIGLPPNAPSIYDSNGNLNFAAWGPGINNQYPFADLRRPATSKTNSLVSSLAVGYELLKGLNLKITAGYSSGSNNNERLYPIASLNPLENGTGMAIFGTTKTSNWTVEPNLTYNRFIGKGRLEIMAGTSLQHASTNLTTATGEGYTNDDLIGSIGNAADHQNADNYGQYKYVSAFGRISYNWAGKYMINVNGRRDGSSRFAQDRLFGNFGSAAVSWIASEENWMKEILPSWFSFLKLRSSYGLTGSDAIGDYQYLSQWGVSLNGFTILSNYNNVRPFVPIHAVNQQYHWEANKKFEVAANLGFLKDKITMEIAWYRNVSDDQLTTQPTPVFSGFPNVVTNSPAKVENTGLELLVSAKLIGNRDFNWSANFNISFNRNKLLAYPGLSNSRHSGIYKIGQSLNTVYLYHYLGIDPLTGGYSIADYNKDGEINTNNTIAGAPGDDRYITLNLNPKYDAGFTTNLSYKSFALGIAFRFQQKYLADPFLTTTPGGMTNLYLPAKELNKYWRKPGDQAQYPRFTTGSIGTLAASDGYYTDVYLVRLNNISFSYSLPQQLIRKAGLTACNFSISTQNVFTITNYKGIDPDVTNLMGPPPSRIITGSLSFTF